MRLTLEQLKAMSEGELVDLWRGVRGDRFPFDLADCGYCLTLHSLNDVGCHQNIKRALETIEPGTWWVGTLGHNLKKHIEELYALRLFHDSLYPPAEPEQPEPTIERITVRPREIKNLEPLNDWETGQAKEVLQP